MIAMLWQLYFVSMDPNAPGEPFGQMGMAQRTSVRSNTFLGQPEWIGETWWVGPPWDGYVWIVEKG